MNAKLATPLAGVYFRQCGYSRHGDDSRPGYSLLPTVFNSIFPKVSKNRFRTFMPGALDVMKLYLTHTAAIFFEYMNGHKSLKLTIIILIH